MSTISTTIYKVIVSLLQLHLEVVKLLDKSTPISEEVKRTKFQLYFKDYVGTIDRSYIPTYVVRDVSTYRNQSSNLFQNVLAIYNFNRQFIYIYSGQEGSAYNMYIFNAIKHNVGLICLKGKYFLVDASYLNSDITLILYRGVRYYLREQELVSSRLANKEELFNLRYSSLRNYIKRNFSIFKMRQ